MSHSARNTTCGPPRHDGRLRDGQNDVDLQDVEFAWPGQAPLLQIERFTLGAGERVFLRGPSGSGKSTLLGLIGGVLTPQRGSVRLLGTDLVQLSAAERDRLRGAQLGFIFQMFNLIPYLSVIDNVLLPTRFNGARRGQVATTNLRNEAERLLKTLGIGSQELLGRRVTELSIGQQQRVAAARALLGRPAVIVADEPTSALDADAREIFLKLLMHECRAQNTTLLFVSHDTSLGAFFDRSVSLGELNRAAAGAA